MSAKKNRLKRERKTLKRMIALYCHDHHQPVKLPGQKCCDECRKLMNYAEQRLDKCPFGQEKPPCSKCTVHCYQPEMRQKVRQVMRYAGPKMPRKHPILALLHLWDRRKSL
ncbi:MAG: nitrous oxide-stimulated promoter family protein [Phycisphaerae bacterium]|nr:nitrous oxide-stimulated promoter family protein [Phycisphaerae bacterium]